MAHHSIYALVDCNNFYVSCERLFNPSLQGKPVIVLSNNDGCAISRSNEAKALGIPMGAPLFKIQNLIKEHDIKVFSSNYTLYQDISNRVIETLRSFGMPVEVYSIDEAFLKVSTKDPLSFGLEMRERILKWTGIPVSIGFAQTKTLAKLANHIAKVSSKSRGVLNLQSVPKETYNALLKRTPLRDIWGIGKRIEKKLLSLGITSPDQLMQQSDTWIRKNLSVVGLKTVHELRGNPCLSIEDIPQPKKNMCVSRSFGSPIQNFEDLFQALSLYITKGTSKLRKSGQKTSTFCIFVETSQFRENAYKSSIIIDLPYPSNDTRLFLKAAQVGLMDIYKEGLLYKKAGTIFYDLTSHVPEDLFSPRESPESKNLMDAVDLLNKKYGEDTLLFGNTKTQEKSWTMRSNFKSMRFTTRFDELLKVN